MNYSALFAGLTTIDLQYFVDSFPVSNKKVKTSAPEILVGGPATNAGVAFAVLNGGASLATATGRGCFSGFVENDFRERNISHYNLTGSVHSHPVIASVITSRLNGDRNIFTHHPEPIRPEIEAAELFRQVKPQIVLLDGFYPEATVEYARKAREQNVPVVLDCGSWKEQYEQLIPLADIVIGAADFFPPGCKSFDEVVDYLHDYGVKKSAISRGAEALLFREGNKRGEVPVKKMTIKDSLGAGDFLHGAFCFYYLHRKFDFEQALARSVNFATFTCNYKGTRSWINNLHTYQQFVK